MPTGQKHSCSDHGRDISCSVFNYKTQYKVYHPYCALGAWFPGTGHVHPFVFGVWFCGTNHTHVGFFKVYSSAALTTLTL